MIGGEALGSIFDFCIAMEGRLGTWSMQFARSRISNRIDFQNVLLYSALQNFEQQLMIDDVIFRLRGLWG